MVFPDLKAPEVEVNPEDLKKLYVHRVPAQWPAACLQMFFDPQHQPTSFDEVKLGTSGFGTTHAHFADQEAADAAFVALKGLMGNDASGLEQKTIELPNGSGKLAVRKMVLSKPAGQAQNSKRARECNHDVLYR